MQKQAPNLPRVLTMVVFALSCFGLLLFLWLSFGGPVPLKPKGYRFEVAFQEAPTLGIEADVRTAGVSVGKVRSKELEDGRNRTLVEIELDREFAPIAKDARVMLRQKTLLGETYVEITPGSSKEKIPEGGRLEDGRVMPAVELDEIFQALDPQTRKSFQTWQQELAKGIAGRGRDFNDALGTLPGFASDGSDILAVLDTQERAVSRLVKNTGTVFGALTENEEQLRNLITGSGDLFEATAAQNDALAETIRIFPTFLDESKAVLARLKTFSRDTDPLVRDLQPVAQDLGPTLRDVRAFAPDLENTFRDLDPLIKASERGLPATRELLEGITPMLAEIAPFLSELNPMLQYVEMAQFEVSDFLWAGPAALAETTASKTGIGHYLRQIGPTGSESAAIYRSRLSSNRGNAYMLPYQQFNPKGVPFRIQPQFDCKPSGGEVMPGPVTGDGKGCWVQDRIEFQGKLQSQFPHVERADYSK
jgi:phospholipid/cholesterol/gamma-HCH transport system substrate-binding protein